MPYDFPPHVAVDPQTRQTVASAIFSFYPGGQPPTPGTELVVTDLAGVPIPTVRSTADGVVPAVRQADHPTMILVSGDYQTTVVSHQGLITAAEAAVEAAREAMAAAQSALAQATQLAAASGIPSGGSPGQALVRAAGGVTTWGAPAVDAAGVAFSPSGSITATTVQEAVLQAAQSGSSTGGDSTVWLRRGPDGSWMRDRDTVLSPIPATRPAGASVVHAMGLTQPVWDTLPAWIRAMPIPAQYEVMATEYDQP